MRGTYIALAAALFIPSTLLGAFFLGSAGLAVPESAMRTGWLVWAAVAIASLACIAFAIQRLRLATLLALCAVPFACALAVAHLLLRLAQ